MKISEKYTRLIFKFAVLMTCIYLIGSLYGLVIGIPRGPDWVYIKKTVFLIIAFLLMWIWYLKTHNFLKVKNYTLSTMLEFFVLMLIGVSIAVLIWFLVKLGVMLSPFNKGVYVVSSSSIIYSVSSVAFAVLSGISIWLSMHISIVLIGFLSLFSAWIITTLRQSS